MCTYVTTLCQRADNALRTALLARPRGNPRPVTAYAASGHSPSPNGMASKPVNMTTRCTMVRLTPITHLAHAGSFLSSSTSRSAVGALRVILGLYCVSDGLFCLKSVIGSASYDHLPSIFLSHGQGSPFRILRHSAHPRESRVHGTGAADHQTTSLCIHL